MPKGEHFEDDSVVWCEEERVAYGACRSLLIEGDQIGARMAFKERYGKELAEARAQGRPVRWSLSAGFDIAHRLATLASAVQEKRVSLECALNFVPGEQLNEFAQMLPSVEANGLLTGEVAKIPDLPGLPGLLAKMKIEGVVPLALNAAPRRPSPADRSPEESRKLREKAKAQIEFLKHSRNGSGNGAA